MSSRRQHAGYRVLPFEAERDDAGVPLCAVCNVQVGEFHQEDCSRFLDWKGWIVDRREDGWIVRITMLPQEVAFIIQGSASEYAPEPDTRLDDTGGFVSCEIQWAAGQKTEKPPVGGRFPRMSSAMRPTVREAVAACRQQYREAQPDDEG